MKVAIIAPTRFLNRYSTTGYHLALAHMVLNDPEYRSFYRDKPYVAKDGYVILDNSMVELDKPLSLEDLHVAVTMIRPDELILPDFLDDPYGTVEAAKDTVAYFKNLFPTMKLQAVPHWTPSHTPQHWQDCYNELCDIDGIDVIGIRKGLKSARPDCVQWLDENRAEHVEHHLLGTWHWLKEVQSLTHYSWIRGIDSKAPVRLGQAGIVLHPMEGLVVPQLRAACPPLDFGMKVDLFPIITQYNVNLFIDWAESRRPADVIELHRS